MRRFDGPGSSCYRPTNTEASQQMKSAMDRMLAERERQDKGLFSGSSSTSVQTAEPTEKPAIIKMYKPTENKQLENGPSEQFYSLSD
jgi:hypothetical protein